MTKEEVMSKLTELAVDMLVSEQHVFELCGVPYLEPKDR